MEQFSLEKYLENPNRKVVTRDGRKVNILKYDAITPMYPVIVSIIREDGVEIPSTYTKEGHDNIECLMHNEKDDLFFADEEDELTEFEKAMQEYYFPELDDFELKRFSKGILDLARKEIHKEEQEKLGTLEMHIDPLNPHYQKGRENALKSLPKWKKAHEHKEFPLHVCVMDENMYPFLDTEVNEDEYYIELSDLKTLPKEE